MSALREAAQQALEALEGCVKALDALHAPGDSIYTRASDLADRAEIALRDALAEQEQEPVAWLQPKTVDAYSRPDLGYETCSKDDYGAFPVYTHPPRCEWQELTEEEIRATYGKDLNYRDGDYERFARAIEQALEEKNA